MKEKGMNDTSNPIYWVIWMPTYKHTCLENNPKNISVEENVSDSKQYTQKIKVELKNDKNIVLSFSENNKSDNTSKIEIKEDACIIELKYCNNSHEGLFVYECKCEIDNELTKELIRKPRPAVAYLLKMLYHNHIFHSFPKSDSDVYFGIYISSNNVNDLNNEAIKHYLQEIEEKFDCIVELFQKNLKFSKNKTTKKQAYTTYNNYLGETFFTNALCCAKCLETEGENDNDVQERLWNIENLKAFLSFICDHYRLDLDEQWANKSLHSAIWGIWISVLLGIGGLFYALYSSYDTGKQIKNIENILLKQNHMINSPTNSPTESNPYPFK